jgi:hypothetical protein
VEHNKLLDENTLLNQQIRDYQAKTSLLERTDSLRLSQISEYQKTNNIYELQIKNLNKTISKKDKTIIGWKIGGLTVSAGLLLFLLLK